MIFKLPHEISIPWIEKKPPLIRGLLGPIINISSASWLGNVKPGEVGPIPLWGVPTAQKFIDTLMGAASC
ncbi:MAG: hypothetical protein C7B46_11460 [Sulfobacillus benefaciens]|uniref:Uncharacterized protein n=1 Tax=Sulfobacillus benefaciens TaxID=453960 RepID=A0A2T2XF58_9FIRM|nr:MAG: hypothetical protein C7B46_11460 [Sulfobacillus benefaciens]